MKKVGYLYLIFWMISACSIIKPTDSANSTLFTINYSPTSADEFRYVYEKNNFNNDSIYTEEDIDNYFDLFLNFKLKVDEAKSQGLDTTEAFQTEYTTYKDQLIKPYLAESKEQERLLEEAYDRLKYEVDASHILISVGPDAAAADTLKAHQKMKEIYDKAVAGEDFGNLAQQYSEDPSAKSNQGRLGYFTAFQMVYAFEEAAYTTEIDSISPIIRSRFGYHILKVHDKRPMSGKVKVSHIMLRVTPNQPDTLALRDRIFEIHERAVGGEDWNDLCRSYSEDQRTKNAGGTLPLLGLRQINDEAFESVAFALETPGEISDPVRSRYGWHIIRLEEKVGLEPFEELKPTLEQQVKSEDRMRMSQSAMYARLKEQNGFEEYKEVRSKVLAAAEKELKNSSFIEMQMEEGLLSDTLYRISDEYYTVDRTLAIAKDISKTQAPVRSADQIDQLIEKSIERSLLDYEERNLITSNRDFRLLLQEYYEGILLFEIMNQKVWNRASEDTVGLRQFFEDNQEDYYWQERVDAAILTTNSKEIFEELQSVVSEDSYELDEISFELNDKPDVLGNSQLDSIIELYLSYERSSLWIKADSSIVRNPLFNQLILFLVDHGIEDPTIELGKGTIGENKIIVRLTSQSKKSLEYLYNRESSLNLQVTEALFEKGDHDLIDSLTWEKGIVVTDQSNDYEMVVISETLEKQPKKLKDVKGLVISDYQDYLEREWVKELRKTNTIEINQSTLDNIKKAYRKNLRSAG